MRLVTRKGVGILLGLMLLASMVVASTAPASSHTTYSVVAGARLEAVRAEATHFFPDQISVHAGDVIEFRTELFHTITILTVGEDPDAWLAANWKGEAAPWSPLVREADEPGALKVNERALRPSHPCGWPTQEPCPYAGLGDPVDDVLNSGLPLFDELGVLTPLAYEYAVEITARPGETLWALSLTNPALRMRIDVVSDDVPASDPGSVAGAYASELQADQAAAATLRENLESGPRFVTDSKGRKVWLVSAGADTGRVSLIGFFPRVVTIRRGQKVRWLFDRLQWQTSMVGFPALRLLGEASDWPQEQCDPDSDAGLSPDTAPTRDSFPYCPDVSQLELETSIGLLLKRGDNSHDTYRELDSSGIRGGPNASHDPYTLRFTRRSRKGFFYLGPVQSVFQETEPARVVVLPRRNRR